MSLYYSCLVSLRIHFICYIVSLIFVSYAQAQSSKVSQTAHQQNLSLEQQQHELKLKRISQLAPILKTPEKLFEYLPSINLNKI